jgi:hypothetical protein
MIMAIRFYNLISLTRDLQYAGTDSRVNLIVNQGGRDIVNVAYKDFDFDKTNDRAQGNFNGARPTQLVEADALNESSFRVGLQGADLWRPEMLFIWGVEEDGRVIPLALETNIEETLSTDPDEGNKPSRASLPIRRITPGDDITMIRRLVVILLTASGDDDGTNNSLTLTGMIDGREVFNASISDTPQDDLEPFIHNIYTFPVLDPFTREELRRGILQLSINGKDKWSPASFAIFGFDTFAGRPEQVVPVSINFPWTQGSMSKDPDEGSAAVDLSVL